MTESQPEKKIIVIPAKNESPQEQAKKRNLRVAATAVSPPVMRSS